MEFFYEGMNGMKIEKLNTYFLATAVTIITIAMIIFPEETFQASLRGLHMWWEIVFPSLFPFFVISELLIGFGVVTFIGVLFDPLMRPLFRVPGVGGFAYAMGMATGFPAGAKISTELRESGEISKVEAERLISFTNSSSPLFIFGAVSVGFFQQAKIGIILAFAHYLSNFIVGILMRFYGGKEEKLEKKKRSKTFLELLKTASSSLHETRLKNRQPLGQLLGKSITKSMNTLFMIGGFIILFSVINKILYQLHMTQILADIIQPFFYLLDIPSVLGLPLIAGIFEITLGSQMSTESTNVNLYHQVLITSMILGFSGFSVQAQVASIISSTDIRLAPYFFARIIQALFSGIIVSLSWGTFTRYFYQDQTIPTFIAIPIEQESFWQSILQTFTTVGPIFTMICIFIYIQMLKKKSLT